MAGRSATRAAKSGSKAATARTKTPKVERTATNKRQAPVLGPEAPTKLGVVATDGGPVLLAPRAALATWEGSRADGAAQGDYHDACQFAGRTGSLERNGATITVLPARSVDVLEVEGAFWLTLEGMLEELWAERASIKFKPLGRTIVADDLVLLDAAYPIELAARAKKRSFELPRRAERYEIDRGTESETGGYFVVWRLRPV